MLLHLWEIEISSCEKMYKIFGIKYMLQYLVGWMFYSFNYFAEDANFYKHLQSTRKKYINNFIEKQMVVSC